MTEFLALGGAVIPIFALVAAGCLHRRLNWLNTEADQSLLRLSINLLVPALIFDSILGNSRLRQLDNLLLPPVIGFAAAASGIGAAWLASKFSGARNLEERRAFALTAGLQNYVYFALPLITLLFDPGTVGVLFVHNLGVETVLWTIGVATLTGQSLARSWRGVLNPPCLTIIVSILLNLLQARLALLQSLFSPAGPILKTAHLLGQCAIPLALLLTGAIVADHLPELRRRPSFRLIGAALAIKLGLLPALYLLLAAVLPCTLELKRVLIVQGAMPSAMFPVIMTRRYGGDSAVAVQVVLATTVASLLLIPLWLRLDLTLLRLR